MELGDGKSYTVIHGNVDIPWYLRYKRTLFAIFTVSCVLLIIAILFFVRAKCRNCDKEESSSTDFLLDLEVLLLNSSCSLGSTHCPARYRNNPPLVLVSLDGFRADYLDRGLSPTLSLVADCGVKADYMYSVYPSKTFPSHYSIVTGLFPSSHGIIDNGMYDEEIGKVFKVGKTKLDDPRWWQKEPIWVTAGKQDKYTATFFWPGSDIRINGSFPNEYRNYSTSTPYKTRIDQVVKWLTSEDPPDFITLYFDQPDTAGHASGPESQEVNDAVRKVDRMFNRLFYELQLKNLTNCINFLFVSDHGMSAIDCDRAVDIRQYINTSTVNSFLGTYARFRPKDNLTTVADIISKIQCKDTYLRVYHKEELPIRYHYVENPRIEPVIADVDAGHYILQQDVHPGHRRCSGGSHGYDNIFKDMRGIFLAYGPSFKKNITIRPFMNIELYELMCELIGINPQPNNGTKGSLHEVLKNPKSLSFQNFKPQSSPHFAKISKSIRKFRSNIRTSNCSCTSQPKEAFNSRTTEEGINLHLPFGMPQALEGKLIYLYNTDYILAYDLEHNFPRWTAFTLTTEIESLNNSADTEDCWLSDPQMENATCTPVPDGFLRKPLYPSRFSDLSNKKQAFFVTNSVLKSIFYVKSLEEEINNLIEKRASQSAPINVIMGPVFHTIPEDLRETYERLQGSSVLPTHFFTVLTWCTEQVDSLQDCNPKLLDVHSFILPSFPFTDNCQTGESIVKKNVARVADVEKVADLTFYTDLTLYEAVRLRTSMSHIIL